MAVKAQETQSSTSTDRIEKHIVLKAPRAKVWRALTDAKQFGEWFRIKMESDFTPGKVNRGKLTFPGYEGLIVDFLVEKIQPEHYFSYRWHPNAHDTKVDYSSEPMTLVEFKLADAPGGTALTIIESGFDKLPGDRRASAFRSNDNGWTSQAQSLVRYVTEG
jgi:uncharacterized protein YndB with AHSA1/START domain